MTKPQSWRCGGCKTWYAPFVEKCECEHDSAEDERIVFSSESDLHFRFIPHYSYHVDYLSPISLTYTDSKTSDTTRIRLQP